MSTLPVMDFLWIVLGIAVLGLAFIDTFITVLNYDEGGILVNRFVRWQWIAMRALTRRVSRRWRPLVLRQATGVLLLTTIVSWLAGMILGFAFIYLGLIGMGRFQLSKGVDSDFAGALYLSVGQFSTAGADNISPGGGWVNLIPVLESLTSVVMLSFIITFLSNIYGVIQLLRSLCADYFSVGTGVGSPREALVPYFPDGQPRELDSHLAEIVNDFNLYGDSLRQDHAAYHFQSGDDQFSLPYALFMTAGTIEALRWGLPAGHEATTAPSLARLEEAFDNFRVWRQRTMGWTPPLVPRAVDAATFAEAFSASRRAAAHGDVDPWVARFLALDDAMSAMIGSKSGPEVGEAYLRYVAWLPFAYRAVQFVSVVSRDLDYQPVYRGVSTAIDRPIPPPTGDGDFSGKSADSAAAGSVRHRSGWRRWLQRRTLFLDPGFVRARLALRTVGAVGAAVCLAIVFASALGGDLPTAGVFAGLIALTSTPIATEKTSGRSRVQGLLLLLPVAVGIATGAMLPRDPLWTVVGLAVVAAAAIWIGRFGQLWAVTGHVLFISYYYSLLLAVTPRELMAALGAAAIGVVCSWVTTMLPAPRRDRQIAAAVAALRERIVTLLDSAIDSLSMVAPARSARVLRQESEALRRTSMSLVGLIGDGDAVSAGAHDARLRVFTVELAAGTVLRLLPSADDVTVTMEQRSHLSGELVVVQELLAGSASAIPRRRAPDDWPASAQHLHDAVRDLASALDALGDVATTASSDESITRVQPDRAAVPVLARSVDKRAVQVGVSTSIALFLGSFVSSTHQYWAMMPAYQTLSQTDGETVLTSAQRIIGTVAGAGVAFGLALWTGHDSITAFILLIVSVFLTSFLRTVSSSWTAFWQTILLATMYDVLGKLTSETVEVRIVETLIGAIVAAIVSVLVLPTRTRTRVLEGMSACLSGVSNVAHAALQRIADPSKGGDPDHRQQTISRQVLGMKQQFDAVAVRAAPLRVAPGALHGTGIEAQLASLSALIYYAARLADNAGQRTVAPANSSDWRRIDDATQDNFDSVSTLLAGRVPPRVHTMKEFPLAFADDSDADETALRDVRHTNITLLAYMESLRPGVGSATPS